MNSQSADFLIPPLTLAQQGGFNASLLVALCLLVLVGLFFLLLIAGIVALFLGKRGLAAGLMAPLIAATLMIPTLVIVARLAYTGARVSAADAGGASGFAVFANWMAVLGLVLGALGLAALLVTLIAGRQREAMWSLRVVGVCVLAVAVSWGLAGLGSGVIAALAMLIVGGSFGLFLIWQSVRSMPSSVDGESGPGSTDELRRMEAMDAGA
ncbi:MAG: hypothetical protein AAGB29_12790 [Planctomycetota bacterium]